jgi:aromatic-L-amino-acid decarboxylase
MANARILAEAVSATPDWRVLGPVTLQTVCIQHAPPGLNADQLDRHTKAWAEAVNRSGEAYVTPATIDGRWMVRVSIGALATETADVMAAWALMRKLAEDSARTR